MFTNHMGRKEVQVLVETYVRGLLSDTRKKNAEAIAGEVGAGRVRAMQRLLVSARWDEDAVVAEHQHAVAQMLGRDDGIRVIDDTGFASQEFFRAESVGSTRAAWERSRIVKSACS